MAETWTEQAAAALAQFDHEQQIGILTHALQSFRMASTQRPTAERRSILDAGKALAERAAEVIESDHLSGDAVGLMVEAGLYLVEGTRKTVAEAGVPAEMLPARCYRPRWGPTLVSGRACSPLRSSAASR